MSDAPPDLLQSDPDVRTSWLAGILSLLGGLAVTAVIGIAGYFYIVSRLPVLILLAIVVEATLAGLALAWLYRRTKVRGLTVSVLIATVCGLPGSGYCLYSFYVRDALDFHDRRVATDRDAMRRVLPLIVTPGTKEFDRALAELENSPPKGETDPLQDYDRGAMYPRTGHRGFYGYMKWLGISGITLMMLHVGLVLFLAIQLGWAEPRLKLKSVAT